MRLAHALGGWASFAAVHDMSNALFLAQLLYQSSLSFDQDGEATWVERDK
jgi:hypothetical protein